MKSKINLYIIEYAINSLLRQKSKNIFIVSIFTFLIFLITSVFFISNSIKYELNTTVDKLPQITIQQLKGGKISNIDTFVVDEILEITGVQDAQGRVWGYYFYENEGVNFTVLGIDSYESQYTDSLNKIVKNENNINILENSNMLVGVGVKKILEKNFYNGYFNFLLEDGTIKRVDIKGVFHSDIELQSNDMIIVSKELAYEILGLEEGKATDIVVKVENPSEIPKIVEKIKFKFPNTRVITNEDYKISYNNIFDYKSGWFLALFIISLFTFIIIVYDKVSGLSSSEKREIGILKAIGWTTDDVLKEKFIESFIISLMAYILGVLFSLVFVYLLDAPVLRYIFEGYSQLKTTFDLPFVVDFQTLFLVFFITVPVYVASTIIPSWRTATLDADDVIR